MCFCDIRKLRQNGKNVPKLTEAQQGTVDGQGDSTRTNFTERLCLLLALNVAKILIIPQAKDMACIEGRVMSSAIEETPDE